MVVLTWILAAVSTLGVGGAVAAFIFFPTVAVPVLSKLTSTLLGCKSCMVAAALVAVALGSYWYGRHGQFERGHTAAVAEIAAEDDAAIARALEKRNVWKECKARSGTWNQSTGDCT